MIMVFQSLFDFIQSLFIPPNPDTNSYINPPSPVHNSPSTVPSLVNNSILHNAEKAFAQLFDTMKSKDISTDTKLYRNMEQLYAGVIQVTSFAHEYNFESVNANGYWTFVRSCTKLCNMLKDRLNDPSIYEDLEIATSGYLRLLNHILNFREITKNGYVDENFNNFTEDQTIQHPLDQQKSINHNNKDESNIIIIDEGDESTQRNLNVDKMTTTTDLNSECSFFYPYQSSQSSSILPLFVPPTVYSVDILREASSNQNQLQRLFTTFGAFWFCKSMRIFFEIYMLAVAFFGEIFPFSLKNLWSRDHRIDLFTKWTQCPSISYPFDIWEILDYKVVCKGIIPLIFLGRGIQTRNIEVPSQSTYVYTRDGKDVVVNRSGEKVTHSVNDKSVKCRLIYKSNRDITKGYLLFHCHGGGFITHSPDSHENYLRQWAYDVPDMTIFSVNYTLKKKFPIALQEVLDTYMWVTSGDPEVAQMIGFQPKKIIFCGDSAGANLALSLLLTLNDLSARDPNDQRLRLPDGIFSIYGAFLLSPLVGPSRVMGAIDPLLSPGVLLTCGGVYGNIADDQLATEGSISLPKWDPCEGVAENVKRLLLATYSMVVSMSSSQTQPWFICDKPSFSKKLKALADRTHTPYASPMTYNKFETLTKIPMQILTSEFCPLLDESITMAKLWKGPVGVDVMEDLPHGFLNFTMVSPEAHKGALLCGKRLKEMFDTAPNTIS